MSSAPDESDVAYGDNRPQVVSPVGVSVQDLHDAGVCSGQSRASLAANLLHLLDAPVRC
jgi:hypothetical protein